VRKNNSAEMQLCVLKSPLQQLERQSVKLILQNVTNILALIINPGKKTIVMPPSRTSALLVVTLAALAAAAAAAAAAWVAARPPPCSLGNGHAVNL
jgi:hypothetical protein